MKVSVSILNEKDNYINAIEKVEKTGADFIHLDIMDSTFTENSSFNIDNFKNIDKYTNKLLDVHLMSTNLDKLIDEYSLLKPEYITFHIEIPNTMKYINKIKEKNIKVGLAINPNTDVKKIYPYLEYIDLVLIMSVIPGAGGQKFINNTIDKVKILNKEQTKYHYLIEIDGGINNETIKYINTYVNIVVAGSYITNSNNYEKQINNLRNN